MKNESASYVMIILAIIVAAALIVFSFALFTSTTRSQVTTTVPTAAQLNVLTISASGTIYNTSSQALLYVTVNGTGKTNALAVENLSHTLNKFNSTILRYVNGNLSQVTTSYFNVYKLYNNTNYTATESLSVTISNIHNVSGALGALSNITNVYVSGATPQLSSSQISSMRIRALSLALANATSQAHALVGTNNTIYTTNISVNNYYVYPFLNAAVGSSSSTPAAAPPPNITITPQFYGGTNKVVESITVVFSYGKK